MGAIGERGSAMIEAAIALPPCILVVVLMIDTGQLMHTHNVLAQVINDSLLYASSLPNFELSSSQNPLENESTNLERVRTHTTELIALDSRLRLSGPPVVNVDFDGATDTISLNVVAPFQSLFPFLNGRVVTVTGEAGYNF